MPRRGPRSPQPAAHHRSGAGLRRRSLLPLLVGGFVAAALVVPLAPALAGAPQSGPAPRSNPTTAATSASSPLWGLGVNNSAVDPDGLETAMGRSFQARGEYSPMSGERYPFRSVLDAKDSGARVFLNINSWHVVSGKKVCYPFANYPTGVYDPMLQNWVNELQAFNYADTFITFTHEPTARSSAQPGCGTAAQYVAAYDYVYHYFRSHGVTYPFVWWMVASAFREGYAHDWQPPASDFSVVAVDGYNRNAGSFWRSPEYIFTAVHNYAASLDVPLVIGEVGSVEDPHQPDRKAAWITDAANLFTSWNCDSILWDDAAPFRPDSTAASKAAWVAAAANQAGGSSPYVANAAGAAGRTDTTWFSGFTPGEQVDVHLDGADGPVIGSATADSIGSAHDVTVTFPSPIWGGAHTLVAVGESSGSTAQGTATISPVQPAPFTVAAGATWTFNALGFGANELVTVTFPNGKAVSQTTDANGSATIPVVSPSEAYGGGYVQIQSPSFSFQVRFHTKATLTMPHSGQPSQKVPVRLTGYGAGEQVNVVVKGGAQIATLYAGPHGTAAKTIALPSTFGRKTLLFQGQTSHLSKQNGIQLAAALQLSTSSGPTGTTVDVTSGPGWVPGETVHVYEGGVALPSVIADANGQVSTSVVIKQHKGEVWVRLSDTKLGVTARKQFSIT